MPCVFSRRPLLGVLTLLLAASGARGNDATRARQSEARPNGSIFPSTMVYDAPSHEIKVLNNVEHTDENIMKCSYHVYSATTLHRKGQLNFGGVGSGEETCHHLASDEYNSNIYIVGTSRKGGLLQDLESNFFDVLPEDTEYYGMVLDATSKLDEEQEKEVTKLQGGFVLRGPPKVIYTVAVASDNSTVYTASLQTQSTTVNVQESSNSSSYVSQNPSQAFPMGSEFELVIKAFGKKEYTPRPTSYDNETMLGEAFNAALWDHPFVANGGNATISNVAGLLVGNDALIVAGSDIGIGSGLGIADSADKTDVDGFVTKLIRSTGELYGDAANTAGNPTSYRLQTGTGHDDFIYGMCPGETHEFVYLTGSTTGNVKENASGLAFSDDSTRAFLIKLNITSMEKEWAIDIGAAPPENVSSAPVHGMACAISPDGDMVYFAGNVLAGGTMRESNDRESLGGSDVFVAKVATKNGDVQFVRQIGSSGDEELAPKGGLVVTADHDIILYGQTNGSLYRVRDANESDDIFDYFMTMMDANGTLEEQVVDPKSVETIAPTAAPTVTPTEPPTETPNGCVGTNCTVHTYNFVSIKLRLEGVGYINAEAAAALEEVMESWYEAYYADSGSAGVRRLQQYGIHDFQTNVSYWGGSTQDGGNLITYNQSITFESNRNDVDDEFAEVMIEVPLMEEENRQDLVKHLKKSHETFAETEGISGKPDVPDKDRPTTATGTVNMSIFIWIAASIFGLCICWGIFTALNMEKKDKTEDYDEKNDIDQPEAPLEAAEVA